MPPGKYPEGGGSSVRLRGGGQGNALGIAISWSLVIVVLGDIKTRISQSCDLYDHHRRYILVYTVSPVLFEASDLLTGSLSNDFSCRKCPLMVPVENSIFSTGETAKSRPLTAELAPMNSPPARTSSDRGFCILTIVFLKRESQSVTLSQE